MLKRYVANDNIIIGAQSGSDRVLAASGRGHGTAPVRDAVRIAVECGFLPQAEHSARLASTAKQYPRRAGRRRVVDETMKNTSSDYP